MAADLTGRTWKFTPGGFPATVYTSNLKVGVVYWNNPVNIGDLVILQEANGKEIIRLRCDTPNISQQQRQMRWWGGLIIQQLDSGILEIETL